MGEFAGYDMPLWFSSALEEHRAVRERAGLFDLGHMGTILVRGRFAEVFLDLVFSNYAAWLHPGQAQYGFLLDHRGHVIDDLMIYRLGKEEFLLVVNAVNEDKDFRWLAAINAGEIPPDPARPWVRPEGAVEIRFLKHEEEGLVDLALQGPRSRDILAKFLPRKEALRLKALRRMEFLELEIVGTSVICARTGYTGEPMGFELYVPKERATDVWEAILQAGEGFGVRPCGLAARDSLRCEAGLPLWGHELAGPHGIFPHEAGFGAYVKLHKPFFVGREAFKGALLRWDREIVRFEIPAGERPVRAGAAVLDRSGRVVGWVTSCNALPEGKQVGMAVIWQRNIPEGMALGFTAGEMPERLELGARLPWVISGKVVPRFLIKAPSDLRALGVEGE
jgi:glycine hydroxymethyltransferase